MIVLTAIATATFSAGAQPTSPRDEAQDWREVIKLVESGRLALRAAQDSVKVFAQNDSLQRKRIDSLLAGIGALKRAEAGYQRAITSYEARLVTADQRRSLAEEWYRAADKRAKKAERRTGWATLKGALVAGLPLGAALIVVTK